MAVIRSFVCNCGKVYKTRSLKRSTYCQQCCAARRERMLAKERQKISKTHTYWYGAGAGFYLGILLRRSYA